MKVLAIISEYNPFHNGHLYQLEYSKQLVSPDYTISIMSGNFTQRGEPALLSKWDRSKIAISCGIDLVIELPFVFACNNAEYFAKGAIEILNRLGCVSHLSFGSESGDISLLKNIAHFFTSESEDFKLELKALLKTGISYPKAREMAALKLLSESENGANERYDMATVQSALSKPNNILGIEYLKQLKLCDSAIEPVTILRKGSEHNSITLPEGCEFSSNKENSYASASAIRHFIKQTFGNLCISGGSSRLNAKAKLESLDSLLSDFLPSLSKNEILRDITAYIAADRFYDPEERFFSMLSYKLLSTSKSELSEIFSVTEGLENKLKNSTYTATDISKLKASISSKRYTDTRINRMLTQSLMGFKRMDFFKILEEEQYYGRILALNSKGAELIKKIKKSNTCRLPLITNINKDKENIARYASSSLRYDLLASDIYNLIHNRLPYEFSDMRSHPAVLP